MICHHTLSLSVILPSIKRGIVTSLHAGRIKEFKENWALLTQDPWVLQTVQGFQLPLIGQPVQISAPPTVADVTRAAGPGINRDTDNGRETGHNSGTAGSEGLRLPDISGSQKGWRPPSCGELEGPEQVHSGGALQDGGLSHGEGFGETWGLVGQNRSEGCLLSSTSRPQSPEVPSVSVAGQPLSIPLPTIRPILCPSHFHEVDEASGCLSERERDQTDYISGRSIDPVQLSRYPDQTSGVYQGLISDVGSDHQQQEIPVGTITRACVPGSSNFDGIDASVFTQRESGPHPTGSQTVTFKVRSVSTETSNLRGHDDSGKTGHPGGSAVSSALASSHKQSGAISLLYRGNETELSSAGQNVSGGHTGVGVVDARNTESQWGSFDNGSTRSGDRIGCISSGLGSNLKRSRTEDRGSVVDQRTGDAYELPRVASSIAGDSDICQDHVISVGDRIRQRKQRMPSLRTGVSFKGMQIPRGVSSCLLWQRFSGRRPKWSWWHHCGRHSRGIPSYFNC